MARCRHLPLNLSLVALDSGTRPLKRCLGADQPLLRPVKDVPATIDCLLLTADHVGHGLAQGSCPLVKDLLTAGQSLLFFSSSRRSRAWDAASLASAIRSRSSCAASRCRNADSPSSRVPEPGGPHLIGHQACTRVQAVPEGVS